MSTDPDDAMRTVMAEIKLAFDKLAATTNEAGESTFPHLHWSPEVLRALAETMNKDCAFFCHPDIAAIRALTVAYERTIITNHPWLQ
jgi:hypothetical protein